jgi:hypothetical protein
MSALLPYTAMGLFCAMTRARSKAALTTSSRLPGTSLDMRPSFSASEEEKGRAVYASSRTSESLDVILGKRESVPMSAAKPMSTSYDRSIDMSAFRHSFFFTLMQKVASAAAYLMSQDDIISRLTPMTGPWTAAMTGKGIRNGAPMEC